MVDRQDALIRTMYSMAVLEEGSVVRPKLLEAFRAHLGAAAAGWLTRIPGGRRGEFTRAPALPAVTPALLGLASNGHGQLEPLPQLPRAIALKHRHGDQALVSTVGLWFAETAEAPDADSLQRLVTHMVAAEALGRQAFVSRDEWLAAFGRSSRGSAAIVDADGAIHAASAQFLGLLAEVYGDLDEGRLPFALPSDLESDTPQFSDRELRFRLHPHGELFAIYVRRARPLDELSPREQEIARALGKGKTFKSVAREKGIAVSTVANHASRIYRKLGIYRREDLVELIRMPRQAGGAGAL